MSKIVHLEAREVLNSRGQPTVEVDVYCDDGSAGRAIVPSGASCGQHEVAELHDGDPNRYDGLGVLRAVANVVETIGPALEGLEPADQLEVDRRLLELDPSPRKERLGANAILGASLAAAHAGAAARALPLYRHLNRLWNARLARPPAGFEHLALPAQPRVSMPVAPTVPVPMTNMISGGLHAGGNLDFQDFLITPSGAPDYATGLEWIVRVYRRLGKLLQAEGLEGFLVGDEGGYGPRLETNEQAAEMVVRAIEAAGLSPGKDITLAIDVAATQFYDDGKYRLRATGGGGESADELIDRLTQLVAAVPVSSIEDPVAEDDWPAWQAITRRLGDRVQLVGDDLFTTNRQRLARGIELGAANAVLIKVNQIGTLSETFDTMQLARYAGYRLIVSARSGETEDATIADLAVATAADGIKIGSVARSERLAKYNRLLRIDAELSP